jgi:hypothetical protein
MDEIETLSRQVTEARDEYRKAVRLCADTVDQASTLGAANPDATFLRQQAHLGLERAIKRFTGALSAYQEGLLLYQRKIGFRDPNNGGRGDLPT